MGKNIFFRIWILSAFIGLIGVLYWFNTEVPKSKTKIEQVVNIYKSKSFSGLVTKRYIDKEQHGYHKVILINEGKENVVIMDWEKGGLFNFIQVGDTLNKSSGSLNVHLKREKLDTVIKMRFIP